MAQGGRAGGVSHTVTPAGNQAPGLKLLMPKQLPSWQNSDLAPLGAESVTEEAQSTNVILYSSACDPDTILPASGPYDKE